MPILDTDSIHFRTRWIARIHELTDNFGDDVARVEQEIRDEIERSGPEALLSHLRLCGDIPEQYGHDSSEEKLYSKYTDCLMSETFRLIGMQSRVLDERGDAADVEAFANDYALVADAKAFRLSRTAKNAKDFKIPSMNVWKRGKRFALVVCPNYQLPTRASQIYLQATTHNVCIATWSHLSLLLAAARRLGPEIARQLLDVILTTVEVLPQSNEAAAYWIAINRAILGVHADIGRLWVDEKSATVEGLEMAKQIALTFLAGEREKIMRMSHEEALRELIRMQRLDSRDQTIRAIANNGLMDIQ